MRNMKMALVVLAVLAMASTSFAGWSISASLVDSPAPGLERWMVHTTGANAFEDVLIVGGVHQISKVVEDEFDPGVWVNTPTLFLGDLPTAAAQALYRNADTHFMFVNDLGTGTGANTETNDRSNPAGLAPLASTWKAGMGMFGGDLPFWLKGAAADVAINTGMDFLQVVIPTGTTVMLTGQAIDVQAGETRVFFEQSIGEVIPEPGTIVMLIAGALCLLVARFRK